MKNKDFEEPREKKKQPWYQIISLAVALLIGIFCSCKAVDAELLSVFQCLECFVVAVICYFASAFYHELGRWLGGVMSGYKFGFFTVGSRTIRKGRRDSEDEDEWERRLVTCKFKSPGKLVQCFMVPPRGVPYLDIPYGMYLLGGPVANLFSIPLACWFLIPFPDTWYVLAIFSAVALYYAFSSGFPMIQKSGAVNDGYLFKLCKEDPESQRAFIMQLCVAADYMKGKSISDMPQAWFYGNFHITDDIPTNPIIAGMWCRTADRFLMNGEMFQAKVIYEAIAQTEGLLLQVRITGLCSLLYAMLLESRVEQVKIYDIPFFLQKQEKKWEPYYLTFCRYRFGHAKLVSDSTRKRNEAIGHFERLVENSPFIGEVKDQQALLAKLDDVELHYGLWGV